MLKQRSLLLLAVSVVAAVVVALLVWLSQTGGSADEAEIQEMLAGIPQDGTALGQADAPVTIRIYEDFQCPACGMFSREAIPELVREHVRTGEVRIISELLAFLGPDSVPAARAALAAGEQDRYWQYAELLFMNQGQENSGYVTDEFLRDLADQTQGLDVERWESARGSEEVGLRLKEARERAQDAGLERTPTLVISGPGGERKLVGAVPADRVSSAVDEVRGG
jgi:protein-disulfide isomerase